MKNRIEKTWPVAAVAAIGLTGLAACSDYDDDELQASAYSEASAEAMEERMDVIERRRNGASMLMKTPQTGWKTKQTSLKTKSTDGVHLALIFLLDVSAGAC